MRALLLATSIAIASPVLGQDVEPSPEAVSLEATMQELIRGLRSRDPRRRAAAAEQLARLGPDAAAATDALVELFGDDRGFDQGVDAEGNILGSSTPGDEAVHAVSLIGPGAVPALIARLEHPDVAVRRRVAEALGQIDDPSTVAPLLLAVKDRSAEVREVAIRYLPTNDPRTLEAYIAALSDRNPSVRAEAARALGPGWAPAAALEPLVGVLQDKDPEVVAAAIRALESIHDERAVPVLAGLVRGNRDPLVRKWAAASLGGFRGNSLAFETLLAAMVDPQRDVRYAAIRAIGRVGDRRVGPRLIATFSSSDFDERLAAIYALGELADSVATEPLLALLAGTDYVDPNDAPYQMQRLREAAALALGEIRDPRAVDALIAVLQVDVAPTVRGAAARSLGTLGDAAAVDPLVAALADVDYVRAPAALALGRLRAQRAVEPVIALLHDDLLDVRVAAAQSLALLGGSRAAEALTRALQDPWPAVRRAAGEALATLEASRSADD